MRGRSFGGNGLLDGLQRGWDWRGRSEIVRSWGSGSWMGMAVVVMSCSGDLKGKDSIDSSSVMNTGGECDYEDD